MFGGAFEVRLRSGRELTCGLEKLKPWVALDERRLMLPPSSGGHGGIELVVSPDERYVAAFMYSGQSEQGWALLEVDPLRLVRDLRYWQGEGSAPQFSPDGRWLAMLVSTAGMVRDSDEYFEDVHDPDSEARVDLVWARLYVQGVPDGPIHTVDVCCEVPVAMDPDELHEPRWDTDGKLAWAGDATVRIGATEVAIPPSGPAVVTPPG